MSDYRIDEILSSFRKELKEIGNKNDENGDKKENNLEFIKNLQVMIKCIDLLVEKESDVDSLQLSRDFFNGIYAKVFDLGNTNDDLVMKTGYILGAIDIYARELSISKSSSGSEVENVFNIVDSILKSHVRSRGGLTSAFNEVSVRYVKSYSMAINRERVDFKIENQINELFIEKFENINERSKSISAKLEKSSSDLEELQSGVAISSMLKDFWEFSKKIKNKLDRLEESGKRLRLLMCLLPVVTMLLAAFVTPPWQYYSAFGIIMLVLGGLLRSNLRSIDQFEQISSKIDNKIAMSMFHKNQIDTLNPVDKESANAEFMRMIYSPIETNEWSAPDLGENIINAIKKIK